MIVVPEPEVALATVRGALGAMHAMPDGPTDLQYELLETIGRRLCAVELDARSLEPLGPDQLRAALPTPLLRSQAVYLLVLLELVLHPIPRELERSVEVYARALDVDIEVLRTAHALAHDQIALMYADVVRNSWYTEETKKLILHGHLGHVLRSKIAYSGVIADQHIERRWRALGDELPGTWGREVYEFYREHNFPLPGARHGIYEVGAHHDWIHVLCGYPPTPEGEIDVFAFIAATMRDPHGFVLFMVTLGLFQNASIRHVAGKRVKIARADTLSDPGAADRLADAFARAARCNVDVMAGVDHFSMASAPLVDVRARFNIPDAPFGLSSSRRERP